MKNEFNLLLVEDNEGDVRLIKELLREASSMVFTIDHAGSLKDSILKLSEFSFDAILLDLGLPDSFGLETFLCLNKYFPDLATTIILTGLNDSEIGLIAVNRGAQDYLIKGQVDSEKLVKSIVYAYERHRLTRELKLELEARIQAEEEYRESLTKYKVLFDSLPLGITMSDKDGNIIESNKNAEILLGLSKEEQLKRKIKGKEWSIVNPEGLPFPEEEYASVKALKENRLIENIEMGIVKNEKEITWLNVTAAPIPHENYGVAIAYNDISKRRLAEEELFESENRYRILFNSIDEGFCIIKMIFDNNNKAVDYQFLEVNPSFEKQTGLIEAKGKRIRELAPEHEESWFEIYGNIALTGQPARFENLAEQLHRWYEVYAFRMGQPREKKVAILFNDITERKQVEFDLMKQTEAIQLQNEELQQVNEELAHTNEELGKAKVLAEENDRLKTAFLANMSHEIRTPMNGILGFADLLKEPGLNSDEQQNFICIIERCGKRMLNIINQLIDISIIESGQMHISIEEVDVNEKVEFILSLFTPEVENKGMQISFRNPRPGKGVIIKTDREKFLAILSNLIKNAIKYSEKGSIELGYTFAETDDNLSLLEFFVKDTGFGIAKSRLEAIFDRFVQADIADPRALQGAGLGLTISKAYVEMLGGRIWVESKEAVGSTFYFTVPVEIQLASGKSVPAVEPEGNKIKFKSKLKVLVAEDDEPTEWLFSRVLKNLCNDVIYVRNGIEAVETCRNNRDIDLVLMDIRMPRMDGYTATRQIRQFNKDLIIIAQTAYAMTGDREKAIDAGCNDYYVKPMRKDDLENLIQKYSHK